MPLSLPAQPITVPAHAERITPSEARRLALELVMLADAAEAHAGLSGFVTRWEVLAELATLRERVEAATLAALS